MNKNIPTVKMFIHDFMFKKNKSEIEIVYRENGNFLGFDPEQGIIGINGGTVKRAIFGIRNGEIKAIREEVAAIAPPQPEKVIFPEDKNFLDLTGKIMGDLN